MLRPSAQTASRPVTRPAFTIVELAVVMSIIVLLAGVLLTAGRAVVRRSRVIQTERTLQLLDLTLQEWQTGAGRELQWWDHDDPEWTYEAADVHADVPEVLIITEMFEAIRGTPAVDDLLARIDPDLVHTYAAGSRPDWVWSDRDWEFAIERFEGGLTILDAWGVPIYATHPGRPWRAEFDVDEEYGDTPRDADGTIRTYNELRYGIARGRRTVFVSAGPDRSFGWMYLPDDHPLFGASTDNLFSTEPLRP